MGISLEDLLLDVEEFGSILKYYCDCQAIDKSKAEALIAEFKKKIEGLTA